MPRGVYERTSEMKTGKYKRTPEHSAALSESLINSDAVKAYADARRGVPRSQETCAKMSKALTGRAHSPETCAKMSDTRKGVPHTPEHNAAISAASTGVPKSPAHSAALSESLINSDANKAHIESMRGGNDLVTHHYIYDHNDLSKNTVQMTRSDHSRLHHLLKKLGYIIPHIYVPDEDSSEACYEDL